LPPSGRHDRVLKTPSEGLI